MFHVVNGPGGEVEIAYSSYACGEPETVCFSVRNGIDVYCTGPVKEIVTLKRFGMAVEVVQSVNGSDPKVSARVFLYKMDDVVTKRRGVAGHMPVNPEFVAVIPVEPVLGSEPDKTFRIPADIVYSGLGQAFVDRYPLEEKLSG
jgi:hypothetical protein